MNQVRSSPRSVQARIIWVGENVEVVTSMDTSSLIIAICNYSGLLSS